MAEPATRDDGITLTHLVCAARSAIADVASASLSLETSLDDGLDAGIPDLAGSVITLTGRQTRAWIGVSSTPEGCRRIAGAMLGMEPADAEELSHDDVRDSVAEFVNIVAGAIKTHLVERDPQLALGLPTFVAGTYDGDSHSETTHVPCRLGDVGCVLTLLTAAQAA